MDGMLNIVYIEDLLSIDGDKVRDAEFGHKLENIFYIYI